MKKPVNAVLIWLWTGYGMVFLMVLIGGITRLTGSGLSMVNWEPIMGVLPPLSHEDWQKAFEAYQQFPQYEKVNPHMTLAGFQEIFWWEYIHRMWGRLLGVVFLIPYGIFWWKGKLNKWLHKRLLLVFALGASQAILGWFMVKSGLMDRPWVSPYRLTAHLLLALGLLGLLLATIAKLDTTQPPSLASSGLYRFSLLLTGLVVLQVVMGGFMAGHKAALYFPTFPLMNGQWVPSGLWRLTPGWVNFFENITMVQFVHRLLGVLITLFLLGGWWWYREIRDSRIRQLMDGMILLVLVQVGMGILTLVNARQEIPVGWAVAHQVGALLLFSAALWQTIYLRPNYERKE